MENAKFLNKSEKEVYDRIYNALLICEDAGLDPNKNAVKIAKMFQDEDYLFQIEQFRKDFKAAFVVASDAPSALEAIAMQLGQRPGFK